MFNMSSAEGQRFAQVATEVTERIRQLGPSIVRQKLLEGGPAKKPVLLGQGT